MTIQLTIHVVKWYYTIDYIHSQMTIAVDYIHSINDYTIDYIHSQMTIQLNIYKWLTIQLSIYT